VHIQPSREDMIEMTNLNPFDRFPDGRPHVPDELLERIKHCTTEEAWGVLWETGPGYRRHFAGDWKETHPGKITIGRAVTAQFLPHREDYHNAVQAAGVAEGRSNAGGQNSWVISQLQLGDVMVVDIFGKVEGGTVIGDNLGTAVATRTHAGAVIDGGIRDYQGIMQLKDVNVYMRGVDPTGISDVTLAGLNIPIRIGNCTVLPGDVVLGTPTGIVFIPPHLAQSVADKGEATATRDRFGKLRLAQGVYGSGEIDSAWSEAIEADFKNWLKEQK